ncbi:MAG TPA: alpha/beta hydrolase [Beijerinckiaceae bacterium]|jgi:pimeloyl-ACP methyl ester carboxylesterase
MSILLKIVAGLALGLVGLLILGAVATAVISWRIEAKYPARGRAVPVAGGHLNVVERGPAEAATTVVLLHGASGNEADLMSAFGEDLARRYRVLAIDRPGHGWSDRVAGRAAAEPARQAAIIAEALRALNVRRAVVVGHSWAGAVLPNLALDHPDVTGGLVALAPVTHPWPGGGGVSWYYGPTASALGWLLTHTLTTPAGYTIVSGAAGSVFRPQTAPPDYVERARIPLVLRPGPFLANAQDVAGLREAVAAQAPRYPEIRVPTTFVAGDADPIVSTEIHSRAAARAIPGAKLVLLPGIGHMLHHVAPEVIRAEIDELVGRVGTAQAATARP